MGKAWGADTVGELDELLASGAAVVAGLRDLPWWRLGEDRLLSATQQVEALLRSAFGVQVRLAAELEVRGVAKSHAVSSTSKLLSQLLSITPGEARGRVLAAQSILAPEASAEEVARSVTDPDAGAVAELPHLSAAVDAGEVGFDHSRVIITAMRGIPTKVDEELRRLCERVLVEAAKDRDANQLKDVAEQIRNITDPDGSLNDLDATDRVELSIGSRRGDGLTPFRGLLDDLGTELLRKAVEPLAKPRPAGPDLPDLRPAGVRRGQALVEVCRRFLKAGDGPTNGGVRPQATVTVGLADLIDGRGIATLDFVGTVSARIARVLACDADVRPILLSSEALPLEAWTKRRSFPPALRRALEIRDGAGCAWPGCDAPSGWCDAHHVVFWANGGLTVPENGVLLCGFHHTEIHRGRWLCRMGADGRPEFIPPRWLDPAQRPRRNHLFTAGGHFTGTAGPADTKSGDPDSSRPGSGDTQSGDPDPGGAESSGSGSGGAESSGSGSGAAESSGSGSGGGKSEDPESGRAPDPSPTDTSAPEAIPRSAGLRRDPRSLKSLRPSTSPSGCAGDRPTRVPARWVDDRSAGQGPSSDPRPRHPRRTAPARRHRDSRCRPPIDRVWPAVRIGVQVTLRRRQ
ncbi:HNH endonuclease signature motif containing protein [Nakamurella lactea]|uniref:HNH endonuclease signature motif containing protein n=1 Tax=Nakamurella lactea TaxID=459515 RepID=UPI0003FC9F30|nr:HNH endonuclease signature motif containing protein [Nakamurella lactea]